MAATRLAARPNGRHRRRQPLRWGPVLAELVVGLALLLAAAVAGVLFVHRPWPNRLDVAGFRAFPAAATSARWHDVADLGSLPVLVGGVVLGAAACLRRDRLRALACLVGPAIAMVVTERVAKPLVGRHLTVLGGNSYPSGTVTAVAALGAVVVLAAPRLLRVPAAVVALVAVAAVSAAVVALRWHFPTDTVGGACVGVGTVLAVDALVHLPGLARAARAPLPERAEEG